jgi:hypothetical protein
MRRKQFIIALFLILIFSLAGCAAGYLNKPHDYTTKEADWIRNGQPITYDNKKWYPTEYIENHLDVEMEYAGEFQKVPFYVERRQIKPFNRIYTKFDYHKYRLFTERREGSND